MLNGLSGALAGGIDSDRVRALLDNEDGVVGILFPARSQVILLRPKGYYLARTILHVEAGFQELLLPEDVV